MDKLRRRMIMLKELERLGNHIRPEVYDKAKWKLEHGWYFGDTFSLLEECEIECDIEKGDCPF